jgi:hypothetical protein
MTICAARARDDRSIVEQTTTYFGIKVEVLVQMEHYSLILFRNQKSIVCTADLKSLGAVKRAA